MQLCAFVLRCWLQFVISELLSKKFHIFVFNVLMHHKTVIKSHNALVYLPILLDSWTVCVSNEPIATNWVEI